jgi:hypothetical protein
MRTTPVITSASAAGGTTQVGSSRKQLRLCALPITRRIAPTPNDKPDTPNADSEYKRPLLASTCQNQVFVSYDSAKLKCPIRKGAWSRAVQVLGEAWAGQ